MSKSNIMRKLFIDGFVIFISIFASFSIENYRESSYEKEILNETVITLGDEVFSNIEYTKEHLMQVKNVKYLTDQIIKRFNTITFQDIYDIHSNNPFLHSITTDGDIKYIKKYGEGETLIMFGSWIAWEPEDVFFQSMLYSGKLLEIKNKKLRREIESIYTKQEERVGGMAKVTSDNNKPIIDWFLNKQNSMNYDISIIQVFDKYKDQELKNYLKNKSSMLSQRIVDIENYLQALQNVVQLISTDYKKLD
tara:strand:+ start:4434 stop:5183 length:750 start_codon:yes stop_codon:yes gene_type:complete